MQLHPACTKSCMYLDEVHPRVRAFGLLRADRHVRQSWSNFGWREARQTDVLRLVFNLQCSLSTEIIPPNYLPLTIISNDAHLAFYPPRLLPVSSLTLSGAPCAALLCSLAIAVVLLLPLLPAASPESVC